MGLDMARPVAWGVSTLARLPRSVRFRSSGPRPRPGPAPAPWPDRAAPPWGRARSADGDGPATQLPDDLTLPQPRRPVTGGRGLGTASAEQVLGVGELGDQLADRR